MIKDFKWEESNNNEIHFLKWGQPLGSPGLQIEKDKIQDAVLH